MLGWHEDGDDLALLAAHEAELGKNFAAVRLFQRRWREPGPDVDTMVGQDRLVLWSVKPPTDAGGVERWSLVTDGSQENSIVAMTEKLKGYGREIVFVFHHEPHDSASDVTGGSAGTAAEFVAAFRYLTTRLRDSAPNVRIGYCATARRALAADGAGTLGAGDTLYPGDEYVDLLAHDRYNYFTCRGDPWEEFSTEWADTVRLAADHGKKLLIGEFGCAPSGEGGSRDDWFRAAAAYIKSDAQAATHLIGGCYYHSVHAGCRWDFLNQADGKQGWIDAFVADDYFTSTPFPIL
jgi:hypothetical protein